MNETLINLGIAVGIPLILGIIARVFPKEKALKIVGVPCRNAGRAISKFGNSKLGSKAMNKIEEGPVSTIIAMLIHAISEFAAGLNEDNVKQGMEEKLPEGALEAFNKAIKK